MMTPSWLLLFLVAAPLATATAGAALAGSPGNAKARRQQRQQQARSKKRYRPLHHACRLRNPLEVERDLPQRFVLGSDESGTGALAGPIVTATCCIVFSNTKNKHSHDCDQEVVIREVQDCKRISREDRRAIYQQLVERQSQQPQDASSPRYLWTTAMRSAQEIDQARSLNDAIADCFAESVQKMVQQLNQLNQLTGSDEEYGAIDLEKDVLSIVDGPSSVLHRTRRHKKNIETVPSRPWVGGDNVVYSVALASIVAHVARELFMQQQMAPLYPNYGFERHQGYNSLAHRNAMERYGLSPIHRRQSCRKLEQRYRSGAAATTTTSFPQDKLRQIKQMDTVNADDDATTKSTSSHRPSPLAKDPLTSQLDRSSFLAMATMGMTVGFAFLPTTRAAQAMYTDSKTGIRLPEVGEIDKAVPTEWTESDNPLPTTNPNDSRVLMSRLDSTKDALFYQEPRFVEHIDDTAVKCLTRYIAETLQQQASPFAVLDLCSSWTSHFPSPLPPGVSVGRVAGLGMNAQELRANPSLTEWVVQDLNEQPTLPYKDDSFDIVLCQLSIDYLTQPLAVCREVGRVLRSEGTAHILFSNRLFLTKAVALWTGADDVDHAYTVAGYLHFCQPSLFTNIIAKDLSLRSNNKGNGKIQGDPLYVVTATKTATPS